jgi:hypothetical protein
MDDENERTIKQSIDAKLREAEIPGNEVEFDPHEAERIAFREDAMSDQDARDSVCGFVTPETNKEGNEYK